MGKTDSTATARMKRWRDQLKADGWKSYTILLPPESAGELDQRIADASTPRRETLTRALQGALSSADAEALLVADAEREITELRATVRRLQAERATLSEQEVDAIGMAAQYLLKGRDKARKNIGERLKTLLEQLDS